MPLQNRQFARLLSMIMQPLATVLVIDDDLSTLHIVDAALSAMSGIRLVAATDGDEGIVKFEQVRPKLVFLDILLPRHNGIELFQSLKAIDSTVPIIFITSSTSSETAIQAIRAGAYDYVAKPLILNQLRALTQSALRSRALIDEPVAIAADQTDQIDLGGDRIVSCSKAMIQVYKDIGRVASKNVTVLIRGESGVGKELIARALRQYSQRADKPFMAVNCAAIPDQLLESELFGHEKGAFTGAERRRVGRFEQCDGGTIFLDEVGDMSPLIQSKMLRLLQEQCFERVGGNESIHTNVRILAATNRPLESMVAQRLFREDLLFRLNGFTIHIPPLNQRRDDIPLLLEYYLNRAKKEMERMDIRGITNEALNLLIRYEWPGNVRQLQSVVRQALLNSSGPVIDVDSLPNFVRENHLFESPAQSIWGGDQSSLSNPIEHAGPGSIRSGSLDSPAMVDSLAAFIDQRIANHSSDLYSETLEQMERVLFERVLRLTGGNKTQAAHLLGISRAKVRERVALFSLEASCEKEDPTV